MHSANHLADVFVLHTPAHIVGSVHGLANAIGSEVISRIPDGANFIVFLYTVPRFCNVCIRLMIELVI